MVPSPSRTAEYMVLFRALEYAYPKERRLFEDPYAKGFLCPSLLAAANISLIPFAGSLIMKVIDSRWAGARTSGIARTRLIDDYLVGALQPGIKQIVILGSGYDCRPYRTHGISQARVFEVDHPKWKSKRSWLEQNLTR